MSTAPTKVVETVKGFNAWTKTWWMRVPEPRDLSLVFTIAYLLSLAGGIVAFVAPPQSISGLTGPVLMSVIGVFLIVGSIMAMFAGAREVWLIERLGVWLMGSAIAVYGIQIGILQFQEIDGGLRYLHLIVSAIALLVFVIRYRLIRIYTFRPRG